MRSIARQIDCVSKCIVAPDQVEDMSRTLLYHYTHDIFENLRHGEHIDFPDIEPTDFPERIALLFTAADCRRALKFITEELYSWIIDLRQKIIFGE
jgi:hypothetical protein